MSRADKVIKFITTYLKVPEGSLVGQPIKLAPFQEKFLREVYDNPEGTRTAILSIARKQGKTALTACILLAHLIGPERKANSQIVSGALSRDQAALVFSLAAKMVAMSPELSTLVRVVPSGKRLVATNGSEFRALAADGARAQGLSPALIILDEAGQIVGPTNPFVEALSTSQGAHESPLMIVISTQAASDADYLSLMIDSSKDDPHCVCHVHAADDGCDLLDEAQWEKSNPALNYFRSRKDLEEQLKRAQRIPANESSARNLLLNQRITQRNLWIPPSLWKENDRPVDDRLFETMPVHAGLDLSMRNDLTALVLSVRGADGTVHQRAHVFAPEVGMRDRALRDRADYEAWARDGRLIAVPGKTIDYDWVAAYMREVTRDMFLASIQFDRWGISHFQHAAVGASLEPASWIPVGQGYKDFSPRMKAYETALLKGRIAHGNHPLLNMAVSNAIAVFDPANNLKLDKAQSVLRIDPLVAAVMSAFPCLEEATPVFDIAGMIG